MSHNVSVQARVTDPAAVAACQRLGLAAPATGTTHLFRGKTTGFIV
jgi:hypothetical protein